MGTLSAEEGGLARLDSHTQLRLDMLHHEWASSSQRMTQQIAALREALGAMARLASAAERESLSSELEAIPAQLEGLGATLSPESGAMPSVEDASHGWEQYRNLSLKLSRLATRIEELALAPQPAQPPKGLAAKGGEKSFKKR